MGDPQAVARSALWIALLALWGCDTREPIPVSPEAVAPEVLMLLDAPDQPCAGQPEDPRVTPLLERIEAVRSAKAAVPAATLKKLGRDISSVAEQLERDQLGCGRATLLGLLGDLWAERDPSAASHAYLQALESAFRVGSARSVAGLLNDLALLESRRQHLRQALEHLAGARLLWRHLGEVSEWANSHLNVGILYLRMGRWRAARQTLDQACDRLRALGSSNSGRLAISICLTWSGRLLTEQGKLESASEVLEEAMEMRRSASLSEVPGLDALGILHLAAGRAEAALEFFGRAAKDAQNPLNRAHAIGNQADAWLRLGNPESAIRTSRRSARIARQAGLGDPNLSLHNLHVQAQAFEALGLWPQMDVSMEWFLGTFEALRTSGQGELLLPFFARRRHMLDLFVLSLAARGRAREAFEVAELARARSLLDHLIWPIDAIRSAAGPEFSARLDGIRAELDAALKILELGPLDREGSASGDANMDDSIGMGVSPTVALTRAKELRLTLAGLEAEMRRVAGAEGAPSLDLKATQELLGPDVLMLVYWPGAERSLLWSVDRDDFQLHDGLPPGEDLEAAAGALLRYLAQGPAARSRSDAEARALSEALLGPVVDRLRPGRPLSIVVEGALATVPFAVLPKPGKEGHPMLRDHPISLSYSVSTVAAIRSRARERASRQGNLLTVVADPIYGFQDSRSPRPQAGGGATRGDRRSAGSNPDSSPRSDFWSIELPRLEASGVEANAIARARGFQPRTGLAASKEWVLGGHLAASRFVHFGTHAQVDPEAPDLAAIELSRVDPKGRRIDGSLRLGDLDRLTLSADLVSLAGCDTALGEILAGEGTMALPRGFLKAGAASVVASLWQVADAPTAELMIELYRQLIDLELAPAEALRAAQLAMLDGGTWADPAYWAGFVLIGDGSMHRNEVLESSDLNAARRGPREITRKSSTARTFSSDRFLSFSKSISGPPFRH